ncbi:MAG: PorV/PorQ family protein [Bacteroidales bacterium]|jgi:hypothetical protein
MYRKTITAVLFFALVQMTIGQNINQNLEGRINNLTYAVPFLTIPLSPAINGVITSVPDGTAGPGLYGNPGLLALDSARLQTSIDYTPWLRARFPDMNLFGIGASYRLNAKHTLGMSFRYFSLGTFAIAGTGRRFHPNEFAGTLFYTYNLDKLTGIGVGLKYIYSNLTGGYYIGGIESHPGVALAADFGFARQIPGRNGKVDHFIGISIKNVGSKISYTQNSDKDFIPACLSAGYGLRINLPGRQSLTFSYEFTKLLVPTPPVYYPDSTDRNGDRVIQAGFDPNVGVFRGMIQSFYDAPAGFQEEISEFTHSFGIVYNYRFLSAGAGYFNQSATKGNNKFFTAGLSGNFRFGRKVKTLARLSVSYLMPVYKNSPLGNTVQVGINFII